VATWTRYAALGDSFTEGLMDVTGPDGRHVGWADRVAATLAERSPGLEYANLAVRGKVMSQVVAEQVPVACDLKPDLVTLAAGVNDTLRRTYDVHASATHLENAVRSLRDVGSDVVLFAFGDPSRRSTVMGSVTRRIAAANAATHAIAERYGCRVVDFWGTAVFDDDRYWDADRLHLSPEGHILAARAALQTLGFGDDRWRTPHPRPATAPALRRAGGHLAWVGGHLGPWLGRRIRGRSSGDGVVAKQPSWGPPPPDAYSVDRL
jgi:lysophospholipase L1-like esterase